MRPEPGGTPPAHEPGAWLMLLRTPVPSGPSGTARKAGSCLMCPVVAGPSRAGLRPLATRHAGLLIRAVLARGLLCPGSRGCFLDTARWFSSQLMLLTVGTHYPDGSAAAERHTRNCLDSRHPWPEISRRSPCTISSHAWSRLGQLETGRPLLGSACSEASGLYCQSEGLRMIGTTVADPDWCRSRARNISRL